MTFPCDTAAMDAILTSSDSERFGYMADVAMLSDEVLTSALDEIESSATFAYLPAASLSVMRPVSDAAPGQTLGTLTAFRGGRIQWEAGTIGTLAQDWQVPHLYVSRTEVLELWRKLARGAVDEIAMLAWRTEQTKLCPICGHDLGHLAWRRLDSPAASEPPFEVPAYETCNGCGTTFGVDWVGATYGEMRQSWLRARPDPPPEARARLHRTPTDHPLSTFEPAS